MAAFLLLLLLPGTPPMATPGGPSFRLAGLDVEVQGDAEGFRIDVEVDRVGRDVEVATIRLGRDEPAPPPALTLAWSLPAHDVHGQWNSGAGFHKGLGPDWGMSRVDSMLARQAPVMSLFGVDDGNRLTFAVSDARNAVTLRAGLREENARVLGRVDLFTERQRPVRRLEVQLRFDRRPVPLPRALADVSGWWAAMPGFEPASVPEIARRPMYSTWYAYHQSLDAEALLREVEIARDLGYEAIIVDDGWQTLDARRGYAFTGDWEPERIPDMAAFVDAVHERGMKLLLWYSMPLVGERSDTFSRFRDKYLRHWEGQGAWVLDPRYPEVREHLIGTYRDAIRRWGVDGFKLDFLGFFTVTDDTELTAADGRDHASVNEATDRLMTDVMEELRRVDPDVMIEFRQPYVGPLMRKYGNMFRAGDAPAAVVANRVRTVDLRLLSGDTAVHSDMLMWHPEESVEVAALQLLNVLFSVPQLSVRLEEIPAEHLEMVGFWTAYWRDNRAVLLDGDFRPRGPLGNYPLVSAHGDDKSVHVRYADVRVPVPDAGGHRAVDVVNATAAPRMVLDVEASRGLHRYEVRDSRGRRIRQGTIDLEGGVHAFDVPPSGLLALERRDVDGG